MPVVDVSIGIIINNNKQILITQRSKNQHQGNKWEFPGGKIEKGETGEQALFRELKEELDIEVSHARYLFEISYDYPDELTVNLRVYEVKNWTGKAIGKEGQPLKWVDRSLLNAYDFPDANVKIIQTLV